MTLMNRVIPSINESMRLAIFCISICICTNHPIAQYLFKVNDFTASAKNVQLNGSATIDGKILHLTTGSTHQSGSTWYKEHQIDLNAGFETEFTFRLHSRDPVFNGGDGFTFAIQPVSPQAVGGKGDSLGYMGIQPIVAIEFDTYNNWEGSKNQIVVSYYNENADNYRKYATVHEIPEINDGRKHFRKSHIFQ